MYKKIHNLLKVSLILLLPAWLSAQVCSTTTLTTQTEVNNFTCTSVIGDLIIEDDNDGVDDIVDLDPIWVNGMQAGNNSTVSGNVIVQNCNSLTTLQGLDGILEIGGNYRIVNNGALNIYFTLGLLSIGGDLIYENNGSITVLDHYPNLTTIGNNFYIRNNPSLTTFNTFESLTEIGGQFRLDDNDALTDFTVLNSVQTIGGLLDVARNDNLVSFTGLTDLQSTGGWISFYNNAALTTVNTFNQLVTAGNGIRFDKNNNLGTIPEFSSLESCNGHLWILEADNLASISGFPNLINVSEQVSIRYNDNLIDISGFDQLTTVNSDVRISNNSQLVTLDALDQLSTIGGELSITINNALVTIAGFNSLTSVAERVDIAFNSSLSTVTGFPSLTSVADDFKFWSNDALESYTGLNNLQTIGDDLVIFGNAVLTEFNGLGSLVSISNSLSVTSNSMLEDCCVFLPIIPLSGMVNIANNATGCNSQSEIGMDAPVITCTAGFTVSTDPGLCTGSVSMTDPVASDDCELESYTLTLINADGTTVYNEANAVSGLEETLILPKGINTYTYTAVDAQGQITTCVIEVEVIDNEAPVWDDLDATHTIFGVCGVDNALDIFNANIPSATDNCVTHSVAPTTISSATTCGSSFEEVHTFQAEDSDGNISVDYTLIIIMEDNEAPTISTLPADVTIFCEEEFPDIPVATASDQCAGDISADITLASSITLGDCTIDTPAEIHTFSFSVDDGCGNVDDATWTVTVMNDFEFDLGVDYAVCDEAFTTVNGPDITGATFEWSTGETTQDIVVNNSGTYQVTVTTSNGCCNSDEVTVTFGNAPEATATGGELNCDGNAVQINGSSTSTGVTYAWTGPGGYTSNEQSPLVTEMGTYELSVTDNNGCVGTDEAEVTSNTNVPGATAEGGSISCDDSEVTLMADSPDAGVTYSWTGPSGFSSIEQNPIATLPGTYTVSVLATNGCIGNASTEIIDDTQAPTASASAAGLNCLINSVVIMTDHSDDVSDFEWTGPNGFTSDIAEPTVTEVGTYTLTVSADNGCSSTTSVMVVGDFEEPNITVMGGTISCSSTQIQITGNSTTANVNYAWTGPNGFTSNLQNPSVTEVGTYTLTVSSQNGCTSSADAIVTADEDIPTAMATGGVINCNSSSVVLMGSSDNASATYNWSGPAGYSSDLQNPEVSTPGTYVLVVTATNGCSATQNTTVIQDTASSQVTIDIASINCDQATVTLESTTNTTDGAYLWSGPNGFTSTEENPTVNEEGTYTLEVTPTNGCSGSASITVSGSFSLPNVTAEGGTIGCTQTVVQLMSNSTTPNISYSWSGPGDFVSSSQNPSVTELGEYTVIVSTENGCTASETVTVEGDNDLPEINAVGGSITCDNTSVILQGSSATPNAQLAWEGPDGFISSEANPEVTVPGTYVLTVATDNGCSISASVTVELDNGEPFVALSKGDVDCEGRTRTFIAATNATNATYEWQGPNGFTSDQLEIEVADAGIYTFKVFPENGCDVESSQELEFDISYTSDITTEDVDDTMLGSATIEISGGTAPFNILWDNGDTGNTATGLEEGDHTVTVIDGLACSITYDFTIGNSVSVVDNVLSEKINVYPSPASEFVNIQIEEVHSDIVSVSIYNINGQLIDEHNWDHSSTNREKTFNVSQYRAGMYLIRFNRTNGYYMKRLIIE